MKRRLLSLCFVGLLFSVPGRSADWDSCRSDLDDLKRRSDDAATKAEDVSDAENKLRQCREDEPNGCEYEERAYKGAKVDLESALDDVSFRISSVSTSCGFDFAKVLSTPFDYKARSCLIYSRYKSTMPIGTVMDMCKKTMSEEECKKCLLGK
jgi:hypothetical protein